MKNKLNLRDFDFEQINIIKWEIAEGEIKVDVHYAKVPAYFKLAGIGVDPGRNFGLATLDGKEAWVFSGSLPQAPVKWQYGIMAYDLPSNPQRYHGQGKAVVEGPAYKEPFGQAELGHVRMGFVLGLYYAGFEVDVVPPATIRANALGSGKVGGLEIWPDLPHNGADAMAAALCAAGLLKGDTE